MASCVCCGSELPSDQGSRTCSMCYGDPAHGKDGYYEAQMREKDDAPLTEPAIKLTLGLSEALEIAVTTMRRDSGHEWCDDINCEYCRATDSLVALQAILGDDQ